MFENATKKNRFIYLLQVMIFALFISGCNMQTEAVIKVSSTQVHVGESVAFDASKSSGGKGKIVSYVWKDASGSILSKNVTFNHAFAQAGKHTVSLIVANDLNESSKATVEINVSMNDTDTIPPVITLKGDANITLKVGDTYTEAGATAVDDRDGNVSVDVSGSVDTSKVGTYTLTYTAKDKATNTSQKSRVVHVALPTDTTPPVITLKGDANITLKVGDSYIEAGATAIDERDGNVSVDVNGTVDVNTTGVYTIIYSATDKAGNVATSITRTVEVKQNIITLTDIEINKSDIELSEGNQTTLSVSAIYDNNTSKNVTTNVVWQIANSSIVSIDNNGSILGLKEGNTTLQAKYEGKVSSTVIVVVYKEINGYRLPPEPDPSINNATLLGVDSNDNGVRDDVERWIYKKYKDKHPVHVDIAMQAAKGYKLVLETPEKAKEIREQVNSANVCNWYYKAYAKFFGETLLVHERIDAKVFSQYFNTKKRSDTYWEYDKLLSGGVYDTEDVEDMKSSCDFDTNKYGE